jgi:hypothetical protein
LEKKKSKLLEKAHSVVVDAQTPWFFKVDVVNIANYLTNQSTTRACNGMTPYQKSFNVPPKLQHLRV